MTVFCNLCEPAKRMLDSEILAHLKNEHDVELHFERWPDGEVVIHDSTLTPEDFSG